MSISFDFAGKKVFITGGSKGIGKAIAKAFLNAHALVAVCARGSKELQSFEEEQSSSSLLTLQLDVTKQEEAHKGIERVVTQFNGLDILINNVGGAIQFGNFWDIPAETWEKTYNLNVLSMVHFSKLCIPYLKESTSPRIINISSLSGVEPGYFNPHYISTKASTINLSKHLANILAKDGILVNCICPGTIETDSWDKSIEQIAREKNTSIEELAENMRASEIKKIPLNRIGSGQDIAPLVLYLASSAASWITGSCFHIDGGKMRSMS